MIIKGRKTLNSLINTQFYICKFYAGYKHTFLISHCVSLKSHIYCLKSTVKLWHISYCTRTTSKTKSISFEGSTLLLSANVHFFHLHPRGKQWKCSLSAKTTPSSQRAHLLQTPASTQNWLPFQSRCPWWWKPHPFPLQHPPCSFHFKAQRAPRTKSSSRAGFDK